MKKVTVLFFIIAILTSCGNKDKGLDKACVSCLGSIVEKTYGVDSTIKIYNVITPNTYAICDYYVLDAGNYVAPYYFDESLLCEYEDYIKSPEDDKCPCYKPKFQNVDKINSQFIIDGLHKFPFNTFLLYNEKNDDEILNIQNYDNTQRTFWGVTTTFIEDTIYAVKKLGGTI